MAKKKLIEHNALVQAIEMGLPTAEIMEKFGIKTVAALKTKYYNALVALEMISPINNSRKKKAIDSIIKINNRGSINIPKKIVEYFELDASNLFKIEKDGLNLFLKVVKNPPKTILRKKQPKEILPPNQ